MVDIARDAVISPTSANDAAVAHARNFHNAAPLIPLVSIDVAQWETLSQRAIEPNGYYLPAWELAASATARNCTGAQALCAFDTNSGQLTGLIPVVSLWRAWKIPLPALVSAHPYGTLCTPLLDRDRAADAVSKLLRQSRQAGAHALVLRNTALDGAAMRAMRDSLRRNGMKPHVVTSYARASLDATLGGDTSLRSALDSKKLKELRRQRRRLEEHGPVVFEVAHEPREAKAALETFLQLEAGGWKGKRGTALIQDAGDATFIRRAVPALAENGQCEVFTLRTGAAPIAAGIVLRHQDRAFFFKLSIDERFGRYSPGVQLTLELTRHLCADPAIVSADSTAGADHPMINSIWRGRFTIGDVLIPLKRNDPMVALIHTALIARNIAHQLARAAIRSAQGQKIKPPET